MDGRGVAVLLPPPTSVGWETSPISPCVHLRVLWHGELLDTTHIGLSSGGHGPASSSGGLGGDIIARDVCCGVGTPQDRQGGHDSPVGSSPRWAALCTPSHPPP